MSSDALAPVRDYLRRERHLVVGLMTGTSADALDAALVLFHGMGLDARHDVVAFRECPLDPALRLEVLAIAQAESVALERLMRLDQSLGELYAAGTLDLLASAGVAASEVDAIGLHGQTVRHVPRAEGGGTALSLQIGSAAVLAERTGITVVSGFRQRDTAAGGEGAPLVPIADWWLARSDRESRALLNLGGIANLTVLPRGARLEDVVAFDTGPGNVVLDALAGLASAGGERFDEGGGRASRGRASEALLAESLADPFFALAPPRSTGRERFGQPYAERFLGAGRAIGMSDDDVMATAVELTAASVADAVRRWVPGGVEALYASGGGVRNRALMGALARRLAPIPVAAAEALGVPSDGKEALAFAFLAHQTLCGRCGNVPGATGAGRAVPLGHVTPGASAMTRGLILLLVSVWAASCAPVPRPTSPAPPPQAGTTPSSDPAPAPAPVPPQTPAAVPSGELEISVGLAWDLDSLVIDPVGSAAVRPAWSAIDEERTVAAGERLVVTLTRGHAAVRAVNAVGGAIVWSVTLDHGDTLRCETRDGPPEGPARLTRWNGKSWRGRFQVFVNARGRLTVATVLPLDRYLLGVIPAEIGPLAAELIEAGRAQTIAARSYTLHYRGRRAAEGFDLYSTVEDQVYGSVEAERPLATRCVETTRGLVALSQGAPIRANYSSTCGGIAADVWEAWPTPALDYLTSHLDRTGSNPDFCAASPHFRWREEWSPAELAANLARFGPEHGVVLPRGGVGDILDVEVRSRSRSGRVWRLSIVTTRGAIEIPAYVLRQVLRRPGNPNAILRSTLFKIDVRRDPATRRTLGIVASGAGSGHGVGLCQTGALGMARAGHKGEAILEHYYPGVELERLD